MLQSDIILPIYFPSKSTIKFFHVTYPLFDLKLENEDYELSIARHLRYKTT